jgi:cation:H+ antiporter
MDRVEAILLFLLFIVYIIYLSRSIKSGRFNISKDIANESQQKTNDIVQLDSRNRQNQLRYVIVSIIGLICVIIGANLVVDNSRNMAALIGISDTVIGVTIVALGTSLPELAVSITSVLRKEHEFTIGNVVGSNIFNILFVISISTAISPIEFLPNSFLSLAFMMFSSIIFWLFAFRNNKLTRVDGVVLVVIYLLFIYASLFI